MYLIAPVDLVGNKKAWSVYEVIGLEGGNLVHARFLGNLFQDNYRGVNPRSFVEGIIEDLKRQLSGGEGG